MSNTIEPVASNGRLIVLRHDLLVPLDPPSPPRQLFRPGDWFAAVAKPVAKFLDKWFKTHYATCGACAKRQEVMNRWPSKVLKFLLTFTV